MCTAVAAQEILDVLTEFIQNKKVFTAYDVTTEARNRTSETVLHNDTRRIIEGEFILQSLILGFPCFHFSGRCLLKEYILCIEKLIT